MSIIGAIVGFFVGILLYVITAAFLGATVVIFGGLATLLLSAVISPLLATMTAGSWIAVALFSLGIVYIFAYMIATLGVLPGLAGLPAVPPVPTTPTPLPASPVELFTRGFMIGLTAAVNFGIWAIQPFTAGWLLGALLAVVGLLAAILPVARSVAFQALLGWSSWLRPMSWFATTFGLILFLVNLPFALATFGLAAVRFDLLTATIETTGGAVIGVTGFTGGFNLGNFTFITPGPPAALPFGPPPVGGSLASHETGHTLNVAAFGGLFQWVNALDENPPVRRRSFAYGELTAESHFPRAGSAFGPGAMTVVRAHVRIWS
jgi:hypothetical protein